MEQTKSEEDKFAKMGSMCAGGADKSGEMNTDIQAKMDRVGWVALESNPEMFNGFAREVGMSNKWEFVDVFGVDPELLTMVPPGAVAVTLLFQSSPNASKAKEEQHKQISSAGQKVDKDLKYIRQYVRNACGTIACIHSLANNQKALDIKPDSPIGRYLAKIEGKSPDEGGEMLADATELHRASETRATADGQTTAPEPSANVDCHFICFVEKGGDVYELDGMKAFPVNHGPTNGDLLKATAAVVKTKFMDVDPDSINFNMMALVKQ